MLITRRLVHCALAFATTTFAQHIQYPLNFQLEQRIGFDESDLNKNSLFSLHRDLVDVESISGNEQAIGEFLEAYLESHNYTVERLYLDPLPTSLQDSQAEELGAHKQRFNLLAYPGEKRQTPVLLSSVSYFSGRCSPFLGRLLILNTCCGSRRPINLCHNSPSSAYTDSGTVKHVDTVPPYCGYEIHKHDQIWGRGSVDAKACVGLSSDSVRSSIRVAIDLDRIIDSYTVPGHSGVARFSRNLPK